MDFLGPFEYRVSPLPLYGNQSARATENVKSENQAQQTITRDPGAAISVCLTGWHRHQVLTADACRARPLQQEENATDASTTKVDENVDNTGLFCNSCIEELYMGHNGITEIDGLDSLRKLHTLDLSSNKIERIQNVSKLAELEEIIDKMDKWKKNSQKNKN